MTTADLVRDYRRAMAHIKAPAKPQAPIRVPPTRRCREDKAPTQRQQVLDTAAKLYQPGEDASPLEIGNAMGLDPHAVSSHIGYFRRNGMWPYGSIGTGKGKRR